MSNETKRDVFEAVWNRLAGYQVFFNGWPRETLDGYKKRYDDALPDDLPVIPKAQSDWIKQCKANDDSLSFALGDETTPIEVAKTFRVLGGYTDKNKDRWRKLQDTFARAWLLGVWRVEETGEIVKLEVKE